MNFTLDVSVQVFCPRASYGASRMPSYFLYAIFFLLSFLLETEKRLGMNTVWGYSICRWLTYLWFLYPRKVLFPVSTKSLNPVLQKSQPARPLGSSENYSALPNHWFRRFANSLQAYRHRQVKKLVDFWPVLRIRDISGSADPYLWQTDPDPAIFVSELQDGN